MPTSMGQGGYVTGEATASRSACGRCPAPTPCSSHENPAIMSSDSYGCRRTRRSATAGEGLLVHQDQHRRHLPARARHHGLGPGQHRRLARLPEPELRQRASGTTSTRWSATSSRSMHTGGPTHAALAGRRLDRAVVAPGSRARAALSPLSTAAAPRNLAVTGRRPDWSVVDRQQEFVLRTLEERQIRFVRLWFTDVLGHAEVGGRRAGRTGRRVRGGHRLRRLGDRGLRPGQRERHARPPGPGDVPGPARGRRRAGRLGADVLRHPDARRLAVLGRPALRAAPRAVQGGRDAASPSTPTPRSSSSC